VIPLGWSTWRIVLKSVVCLLRITANLSTLIYSLEYLNFNIHEGFYFLASCQPLLIWPKNILITSKQRILWMKAAFASRVNLVTQVAEVADLSCWSRKSRIVTEAHKKLFACSALKGTSQHLNKVLIDKSYVHFLFIPYFFSCEGLACITTCIFFKQLI